jgi:hypothetical protein
MQRFGFKIQTRTGMTVDNLVIHAADRAQAEGRLLQMYQRCTILECRTLEGPARGDATDLEGAISLIVEKSSGG